MQASRIRLVCEIFSIVSDSDVIIKETERNATKVSLGCQNLFLSILRSFFSVQTFLISLLFLFHVEIAKLFKQLVRQISRKYFSCGHSDEKTLKKMYSFD